MATAALKCEVPKPTGIWLWHAGQGHKQVLAAQPRRALGITWDLGPD